MKVTKRIGWIGLCVLALLAALGIQLLGSVVGVVIYGIVSVVQAAAEGNDISQLTTANLMGPDFASLVGVILVVVGILLLIVFLPWFYFGCGRPRISRESAKRVFAPRTLLTVAVIAVGLNYGINCLLQLVYAMAPQVMERYQELIENAGIGTDLWSNAAAVILAPLGEELIFRGVILHYANRAVAGMKNPRAALWIANIVQALLFGIYHMNLVQGIYAFAIGLALGYLCQRYRSVIPGMLAHLVFNGMSALLEGVMYGWIPESTVWYAVIAAVSVGAVLAVIILNGSPSIDNEQNVA